MRKTLRIILLTILVSIVASTPAEAQDTLYARQVLERLSSPQFYGRGYSYKGDSIAAAYIRNELKRLGVKPLGDNYYQPYTFSAFSMEGPLSLSVNGETLQPFKDYRVAPFSASTFGTFDVITVPPELLIDGTQLAKFLKKNKSLLADVVVYVDATSFKPESDEEQKTFQAALRNLRRRNSFNSKAVMVGMKEMNTCSPAFTDYEHGYAYIEVLAEKMPKKVKTLHCGIFTQFHPQYATQNVCGYVPGECDTMIVYTAHYDHLGTMGDDIIFYGAHDNASGVAAVLDLARVAVHEQPHYTHVFCFFSGEEAGLKGSEYAAKHPLFDFDKVRLLVNIDMFCGGDEGIMVFNADDPKVAGHITRLEMLNEVLEIAPEIRRRKNSPNSDHYHFTSLVPAIYVLSMGQRYGGYHDPADNCQGCSLEHYLNYLTLISSLAL